MRYLVVDDSRPMRLIMRAAIARAGGTEIEEASDAAAALEKFRAFRPDVTFLDMMLGTEAAGLPIMAEMLEDRPEAKVVLVTGLPRTNPQVTDAISMGAAAFLEKPVRADEVKRIMAALHSETAGGGSIK